MTRAEMLMIAETSMRRFYERQDAVRAVMLDVKRTMQRYRIMAISVEGIKRRSRAFGGHPTELRDRLRARWSR